MCGRSGGEAAAAKPLAVIDGAVEHHPANPGARRLAADVEIPLRNLLATQAWIR